MLANIKLHFTGKNTAIFYVWVFEKESSVRLEPLSETSIELNIRKPDGEETTLQWNESLRLAETGIWEIILTAKDDSTSAATFIIHTTGDAYPFVIPGPGITPSHFPVPEPTLLFASEGETEIWVDVPDDLPLLTIGSWVPASNKCFVQFPDGTIMEPSWNPDQRNFYRVTEIETKGQSGWWKFSITAPSRSFRWTVWEGLPIFLSHPPERFPYARIFCSANNEEGKGMDAHFRMFRHDKLTAIRDDFADTHCILHAIPGESVVQASHGIEFERSSEAMSLIPGETKSLIFRLRRLLHIESGWVCGDHHSHSYFEDGGQSPEKIVRSARAEGLNYIFITDEPEPLIEYGLDRWNKTGEFLALPGQEVATDFVHMNALNVQYSVNKESNEISDWLIEVKKQNTSEHPATMMLNHPSHVTGIEKRLAYFRSWWVADKHDQVILVENFDFASWFERLNQGRKLTGLWTTDGHDVTFLPPGKKRTYVFVGDELNERALIEALKQGRCFNTRYPGAWLMLTVNGAMVGETAKPDKNGILTVSIRCEATRPLDHVELISDGQVIHVWHGEESLQLKATIQINASMKWLIARTFVHDREWESDGHSMEPIMASGCVAFTNPIWIER